MHIFPYLLVITAILYSFEYIPLYILLFIAGLWGYIDWVLEPPKDKNEE